jgi:predicted glycosyltransferase
VPPSVRKKMTYTGYLPRTLPQAPVAQTPLQKIREPFLLVTTGGGGDGEDVIDWVLRAYEYDRKMPLPALLVLGPFMQSEHQAEFLARVSKLKKVEAITFEAQMESLMARAAGIVAMGGYNTFCEILSFDKRALLVPRTAPRLEQYIRAQRAEQLGLVRVLAETGGHAPEVMATALRHLPQQPLPSQAVIPGLLDGQANVDRLIDLWLSRGRRRGLRLAGRRGR